MADEINGNAPGATGPAEPHVEETAKLASPSAVSGSGSSRTGRSEWTASDARGPLNAAPPLEADHVAAADIADAGPIEADAEHPKTASDTTAPEPADHTSAAMPSPVVAETARPRRSLLPVAAGLVVGALIGAGSAYLVYQSQPRPSDDVASKIAPLSGRIDALEQRPDPQASLTALKASVADLSKKVGAIPTAQPAPAIDTKALEAKIAALQTALDDKVGALRATVDGLQLQGDSLKTLQADLAGVKQQASGAQAGVTALQGQQKSFEGRIGAPALAVVADSLVQQIDQGQPYAQQVDALASLGADPARIAVLRQNAGKGVPSAKALAAGFAPLAEPMLATAHRVAPDAGLLARLKSGMSGLVSIRSTSDTTGDDLGSRVSRIEADLTHDDIAGAYATWAALPAEAKAKSDAWGALAKTSAEAIDAAHALQQGAIAALGGRKS